MPNPYDSDRLLAEYLLFHYGSAEEVVPRPELQGAYGFPARCVTECLDMAALPAKARALDLGCAVGRSSFELARWCEEVVGIDFSRRFITAAEQLQQMGLHLYERREEGDRFTPVVAKVPEECARERVRFEVGNAQELRPDLGSFDVVLMANLIDRLPEPRKCLKALPDLVRTGGQLIITSPYTWLPEFTPREEWLCDEDRSSWETLVGLLSPSFSLQATRDLPFLIREHARKFQWSVAEATIWRRTEDVL